MKLKILKIVEIVSTCIGVLVALMFVFFICQKSIFENKPMGILGINAYEATNVDLEKKDNKKTIEPGDLVITLKIKNYSSKDIILFKKSFNEEFYIKSVGNVDNDQITTLSYQFGYEFVDGTINKSDVEGKVIFTFHNYAKFRSTCLSPVVIIILGVIFFGGFIACFILEKVFTPLPEEEKKINQSNDETNK